MPDFVYNIARGRVAEFYNRVKTNDPANSALVIVVINTTETDAVLKDLDNLGAILSNANTAEVTNTNYVRKILTEADLNALTPDDANDRMDLDFADQTWSSVAIGGPWTDLIVCYDPDATVDTDAELIPLTHHDFSKIPDGSDITAALNAAGFYRAT